MLLLLQNDNDITRLKTRGLIALSIERYLLSIFHALVDVHLENLSLLDYLSSRARLTHVLGVDSLSLTVAISARRVNLLIHAGAELVENDLAAGAFAGRAALECALFAALALALVADDVLLEGELACCAIVHVLERHAELVDHVLALVLASAATTAGATTEEHLEDVHWRTERALRHAALFERLLTSSVVDVTLLRVAEHFVCVRDMLELLLYEN